jgi:D-alanyl-D-alanine carboxypeptidase
MLLVGSVTAAVLPVTPAAAAPPAVPHIGPPVTRAVPDDGDPVLRGLLDGMVATGASGALARVDDGTGTVRLAAGRARLEPAQAMAPAARFRVGSVTKTFIATVALMQEQLGHLSLDDTVEHWLPGLVPGGRRITLRMLLNHTSGLYNYTDDRGFVARYQADPTQGWAPRQLVALAAAHRPLFPPGRRWSYSNTNYIVAGMLIEKATGQNIHRMVRERIIDPLHLTGTSFPAHDRGIDGFYAHGYLPPSPRDPDYTDVSRAAPSLAWTAGAVISTVDDLRTFYRALLGGRLLHAAQLHEMLTTVPVTPVFAYGLGIFSVLTPCGLLWGHDGDIPGYHTMAFSDPTGRRGYVLALPTDPGAVTDLLWQTAGGLAGCQALLAPSASAPTPPAPEPPAPNPPGAALPVPGGPALDTTPGGLPAQAARAFGDVRTDGA